MNDHDEIRELLALAVAGGISPAEEDRVALHMRSCTGCAAEFDSLRLVAERLRRLPTPQPSRDLVERTRARAAARFVEEADHHWHRAVMIFLTIFAWAVTLASWPVFRLVSGGLLGMLDSNWNQAWIRFASFATFVWLAGGAAALLVGLHRRGERSMA
jgi:predicted anti-sigma-YlaC factor YlaD